MLAPMMELVMCSVCRQKPATQYHEHGSGFVMSCEHCGEYLGARKRLMGFLKILQHAPDTGFSMAKNMVDDVARDLEKILS